MSTWFKTEIDALSSGVVENIVQGVVWLFDLVLEGLDAGSLRIYISDIRYFFVGGTFAARDSTIMSPIIGSVRDRDQVFVSKGVSM